MGLILDECLVSFKFVDVIMKKKIGIEDFKICICDYGIYMYILIIFFMGMLLKLILI